MFPEGSPHTWGYIHHKMILQLEHLVLTRNPFAEGFSNLHDSCYFSLTTIWLTTDFIQKAFCVIIRWCFMQSLALLACESAKKCFQNKYQHFYSGSEFPWPKTAQSCYLIVKLLCQSTSTHMAMLKFCEVFFLSNCFPSPHHCSEGL